MQLELTCDATPTTLSDMARWWAGRVWDSGPGYVLRWRAGSLHARSLSLRCLSHLSERIQGVRQAPLDDVVKLRIFILMEVRGGAMEHLVHHAAERVAIDRRAILHALLRLLASNLRPSGASGHLSIRQWQARHSEAG